MGQKNTTTKKPNGSKKKKFATVILKYLETNKNKKTYQNLGDASKSGVRKEFYSYTFPLQMMQVT